MTDGITALAAAARKRNAALFEKRNSGKLESYLRQIAERDAEIAALRKESEDRLGALIAEQEENEALKREVAMFKEEIAELKGKLAAPAPAATRKGRGK